MRAANSCEGQWSPGEEHAAHGARIDVSRIKGTASRGSYEQDLAVEGQGVTVRSSLESRGHPRADRSASSSDRAPPDPAREPHAPRGHPDDAAQLRLS